MGEVVSILSATFTILFPDTKFRLEAQVSLIFVYFSCLRWCGSHPTIKSYFSDSSQSCWPLANRVPSITVHHIKLCCKWKLLHLVTIIHHIKLYYKRKLLLVGTISQYILLQTKVVTCRDYTILHQILLQSEVTTCRDYYTTWNFIANESYYM